MTGRLRTGLRCLAYVGALLVVVVGADRLLAAHLYAERDRLVPAYRSFNERSVGVKLHELEESDERFDTLLIGNSRTLFAVRPDAFDEALAGRGVVTTSFNLAMPTIDPRFWPPFFERFYDRQAPRHLLLGLIPRDLDRRNDVALRQAEAFTASPGFANRDRSGAWRWAEEELARLFLLRGRGNEIRNAGVRALLRGDKLDRRDFGLDGERGWARYDEALMPSKDELAEQARRLAGRRGAVRLEPGREQLAALVELDRWVRARGGCLTLFTTPLLYDREPLGTLEVQRDFQRLLRSFVREHPTIALADVGPDVEGDYGLEDFGDGDHLAAPGAERFSRELADAVAPRLRGCGGR